jgi:hypothetical protein
MARKALASHSIAEIKIKAKAVFQVEHWSTLFE